MHMWFGEYRFVDISGLALLHKAVGLQAAPPVTWRDFRVSTTLKNIECIRHIYRNVLINAVQGVRPKKPLKKTRPEDSSTNNEIRNVFNIHLWFNSKHSRSVL